MVDYSDDPRSSSYGRTSAKPRKTREATDEERRTAEMLASVLLEVNQKSLMFSARLEMQPECPGKTVAVIVHSSIGLALLNMLEAFQSVARGTRNITLPAE